MSKKEYMRKKCKNSRKRELEGLVENGALIPTNIADVPHDTGMFNSRFVDELRKVGESMNKKSRLVAQNYEDEAAAEIETQAPTVQRFSQRLLLSIEAL